MENVEMTMQPDEFADLRAQVAAIAQGDVQLGHVLDLLVLHLGHSHGLDPVVEDARLRDEARKAAREEEDARLVTEADDREKARVAEDAQPRTPEQQALLSSTRAAEDVQVKTDAEALVKAREEEDTRLKVAQEQAPAPTSGFPAGAVPAPQAVAAKAAPAPMTFESAPAQEGA
jgi:hypothetical protein